MHLHRINPLLLTSLLLVGVASSARAQERETAKEHFLKGSKAFDLGLYEDAIKEYMAAYQIKDDPALIYNIAQAHRLAGHASEALRFYKVYLLKEPHAHNRSEVELKINELKKLLEQQKHTQSLPPDAALKPDAQKEAPPAAPPVEAHPETPPPAEAAPAPAPTQEAPAETPPAPVAVAAPGKTMKLAGIGVAAGGVALVAVGIAFGVLAKQNGDALSDINSKMGVFDASKEQAGKLDQTLEGVFLGIGAAAVAAGVTLTVLGWRKGHQEAKSVSFVPLISPRATGATLHVRF